MNDHALSGDAAAGSWETVFCGYRLVFGAGALDRLGELTRELGGSRPLLVTDRGLVRAGHVERAGTRLREASLEPAVYDGVEENPTTRHVAEGVDRAREHGADCIVALGGGSAMDCAKGINFLLTNGGRMEDYRGHGKAIRPMLPSLGAPTTAGTGSEAQSYALICDERSRAKMACGDPKAMFRAVILDPLLAATVPEPVVGVAGVDALSHAVESYVCTRRNPVSQLFAREAWSLLESALPEVLVRGDDLLAWGRMMFGAHLAGAAIEHSMLGAAHACANPLTARFSITHGVAVGLMLPHVMRFNAAHAGSLYDELQRQGAPNGRVALLDERVVQLRAAAGLPERLRDCGVPRDCLSDLASEAERQWTVEFNPRPVDRKGLVGIYEAAF